MNKPASLKVSITRIFIALTLAGALIVGAGFSYYSRSMILHDADMRLLSAVSFSQQLVGKEYHDLIINDQSVAAEEYLHLVNRHDQLCRELGLQYIWSNLVLTDQIVFTSATRTDVTEPSSPYASFYQQHSDPEAFHLAMGEPGKAVYSYFHNEWGTGRMVLVPHLDSHGRRYILGASIQLYDLNSLLYRATIVSVASGFLLLFGFGGAILHFTIRVTRDFSAISHIASEMKGGHRLISWPATHLVEADNICTALKYYHQQLEQRLKELTFSKRKDQLKNDVLTKLARAESLQNILDTLVRLTEDCDSTIRSSILLYDADRGCLVHASAPRLPEEYNDLIRPGLPIGSHVGSCGSAAYLKQLVIVEDIQNSPRWTPYPDYIKLTRQHQLLACWSMPILANDGSVLGTIANYSNKIGAPTPENLDILHWSAEVAALAIEKLRTHQAITASELKFRTLFDQSLDEIYLHDVEGKILDVNQAATTGSGYNREQLLTMLMFDLWPNTSPKDDVVKQWQTWVMAEGMRTEATHRKADDSLYDVDLFTNKINFDNKPLLLAQIRDITARKQSERALRQSTEVLQRNNTDLLRLGEIMAHHFQESTRRMATFSRMLRNNPCTDPDSQQAIDYIDEQANRLSQLVRRIQRYLELDESAPGTTAVVDVKALIHQTLAASAAADADLHIAADLSDLPLPGARLRRILSIVFDNSGHYRRSHVPLAVQVTAVDNHENLELRIADNGCGIEPAHRVQVLELFTNLAPGKNAGSGLALARRIMRLAGGDLRLEDGIDGGVAVVLTFGK